MSKVKCPVWREKFYKNLPLLGETIKIRSCKKNDADFITELNNDECTMKYLNRRISSCTVEETQEKISESHKDTLYIIETSEGHQVGNTGFFEDDQTTDGIDILIKISSKFTKKKIGKEVLDLMVKNWENLFPDEPIAVTIRIDNCPAKKLLEGSGFVRIREYEDPRDNYCRHAIYKIKRTLSDKSLEPTSGSI